MENFCKSDYEIPTLIAFIACNLFGNNCNEPIDPYYLSKYIILLKYIIFFSVFTSWVKISLRKDRCNLKMMFSAVFPMKSWNIPTSPSTRRNAQWVLWCWPEERFGLRPFSARKGFWQRRKKSAISLIRQGFIWCFFFNLQIKKICIFLIDNR